ncbi:cytochrome P450 [Candidatus Rhodobacter oscarellae]|uniref:cytochrome P450 n=1 Tax=Candidatus Rhodobacter oscarellae TaxID=1675527 RepID=UPI000670C94F|nr:cytochrome P450 [Candidatus Rhodobacter lobularis]
MPTISQSPTDPAFVQDPYPFYARARALGPLVYWDDYALPCTTALAATSAILRDRRFGREPLEPTTPEPHTAAFYAVEAHSMLELEPPRHTRLRGLVLRAFTSRRIAALAPEIEALCAELMGAFPHGDFDLLPAYCTPLPVRIIARLLGVPEDMAPDLLAWSNAMVAMYQARRTHEIEADAARAALEFSDFLRLYVKERRSRPADDLITHLIAAEEDGERLSTDELITTCILLLNAGHEATVHTLGNGVKALLEHGPDLDWLTGAGIDQTVEEILRFDPPLHMFTRYAYEDIELFGHAFRRGDEVACLLAAASHDPAATPNAQAFDPTRRPQHLSFGAGLHFCVGAPLARLELKIALQALFARHPKLRLAARPSYANLYHFHGLERLIVRA